MAKKIYDIFHPEEESSTKKKEVRKQPWFSASYFSRMGHKKLGIVIGLIFLTTIIFGYLFFLRVDIYIWPETKEVQFAGMIDVRVDVLDYNLAEGLIPGKSLVIIKEEARTFSSSGKAREERRAEGTLRVFNNHSSQPQRLVARTRFVSADGKLFRSTEAILIPGYRQEGGRTIPGEVMVSVIADAPGDDFNIERTTNFSVPGLFGTPLFTTIYAENPKPITGGFIGELPLITKEDIASAREILFSTLRERAIEEMRKIDPEFIFNIEDVKVDVVEEFSNPEEGESYDSFEYFIKIQLKTLAINQLALESFLKDTLLRTAEQAFALDAIFSAMKIWEGSLDYTYSADLAEIENGRLSLEISARALAHPEIIEGPIKDELSGMPIDQARMILEDHNNIRRVEIYPRPAWLRNIPAPGKIIISLKIEE